MIQINKNQACFPHYSAKLFEIILIIGFLLTIILLIINLSLTEWFFKSSTSLFIIEILLLVLNASSIILSIILRIWRYNGSILNTTFTPSYIIAIINLVIVIINVLLSIVEEILFSFVFPYIDYLNYLFYFYDFVFYDDNYDFNGDENDGSNDDDDNYDFNDDENDDLNYFDVFDDINDLNKNKKNFYKIMDKLDEEKDEFGLDEDDDDLIKVLQKLDTISILPWIAINFNILIQIIMFIFIIIIFGRIKRKSEFGFSQNDTNQTPQNRMLEKAKSSDLNNLDSEEKNLGKKKRKRKTKTKSIKVHNKY